MQENYKTLKQLQLPNIDKEVLELWQETKPFEYLQNNSQGKKNYVFYDGPPSANGMPGIHHILSRTLKDLFCRYHSMQGKHVHRKAGWDTHGLPIELTVEKNLGIKKEDIGIKISVEAYNEACKKQVYTYKEQWDKSTIMMGYWVDLENPYITLDNNYISSIWWSIQKLYNKNLLYKGYTIQPYSPAAGTGISSHELNQPGCYRSVKDNSVVAMFELVTSELPKSIQEKINNEKLYLLAWTTTPWTLPSNTALSVNEKIIYSIVKTINPYTHQTITVIMAESAICRFFDLQNKDVDFTTYNNDAKNIPYKVIAEITGKELEGIHYTPLYTFETPIDGNPYRVVCGEHVTTEDGTGVVHTAPCFGADDMQMHKKHNIGTLCLVDKKGCFVESVIPWKGLQVKDFGLEENYENVDVKIIIDLKQRGLAFKAEKYEHNYPHCWRTDKPIIYYPLDSWFIKTSQEDVKTKMINHNKTIQWKPESIGTGRFGQWLENLQDWNLSRSRFWGTPLPIWRDEASNDEVCIGSIDELIREYAKYLWYKDNADNDNIIATIQKQEVPELYIKQSTEHIKDLHKPYIDNIKLISKNGNVLTREADLIDVWYDSGAMPFAQYNADSDEKIKEIEQYIPADFIAEGVDQTRGWFYTLHALSVMLFDKVAYRTVVSNGLVVDKNGIKMSKRLGNVVDPIAAIQQYGADATRWYLISASAPWESLKFDVQGIADIQRGLFGTLYNTYAFFALYANIDNYTYNSDNAIDLHERTELDRWIISELNSLIQQTQTQYEMYEPTKVARMIQYFINEQLSNWYVRLSRRRFWKSEMNQDKQSAFDTLHECLNTVVKLMAPIAPFFTEWMYTNLSKSKESIHIQAYPKANEQAIRSDLQEAMFIAQEICSLALSLRKKSNIKVRQPLQTLYIPLVDNNQKQIIEKVKGLILSELNVKELQYIDGNNNLIKKKIKPNYKTLGSMLGADMKEVSQIILQFTQEEIFYLQQHKKTVVTYHNKEKKFELDIKDVEISSDDVAGMLVANNENVTVALDISISPELRAEGHCREFVNKVQNLRKLNEFQVLDKIKIHVEKDLEIFDVIKNNETYICNETLASEILVLENGEEEIQEIEVNEVKLKIKLSLNPL